jgi:hypothetical protein
MTPYLFLFKRTLIKALRCTFSKFRKRCLRFRKVKELFCTSRSCENLNLSWEKSSNLSKKLWTTTLASQFWWLLYLGGKRRKISKHHKFFLKVQYNQYTFLNLRRLYQTLNHPADILFLVWIIGIVVTVFFGWQHNQL